MECGDRAPPGSHAASASLNCEQIETSTLGGAVAPRPVGVAGELIRKTVGSQNAADRTTLASSRLGSEVYMHVNNNAMSFQLASL